MERYCGVWRDPISRQIYRMPGVGQYEAQMILPEDVATIEAKVILEEVLGLARQA